ncbi:hypothetical protein D918_02340 [Trichuris suis]|nr:hypothetical protein D918_02340 [Trichuris suis]
MSVERFWNVLNVEFWIIHEFEQGRLIAALKRYTAEECLKHPWIESDKLKYMAVRREAVISLQYAHSIEARRRWQMVICLVTFCIRLMKRVAFSVVSDQPELHKDVKSDQRGSLFFHPVRCTKFLLF